MLSFTKGLFGVRKPNARRLSRRARLRQKITTTLGASLVALCLPLAGQAATFTLTLTSETEKLPLPIKSIFSTIGLGDTFTGFVTAPTYTNAPSTAFAISDFELKLSDGESGTVLLSPSAGTLIEDGFLVPVGAMLLNDATGAPVGILPSVPGTSGNGPDFVVWANPGNIFDPNAFTYGVAFNSVFATLGSFVYYRANIGAPTPMVETLARGSYTLTAPIPAPPAMLLLGSGLMMLLVRRRRRTPRVSAA